MRLTTIQPGRTWLNGAERNEDRGRRWSSGTKPDGLSASRMRRHNERLDGKWEVAYAECWLVMTDGVNAARACGCAETVVYADPVGQRVARK